MKFGHSREINVPIDYLFDRACNFAVFEKRGIQHGIEVHRQSGGPVVAGYRWQIAGILRGKPREAAIELVEFIRPDLIGVMVYSSGFQTAGTVRFIGLTKRSSRIETEIEIRATTLRARLILQALRLARGRVAKRIRAAINLSARKVEEDYRAASR